MLLNCHPVHSCIRERRRPHGLDQGAEQQPVTLQRGPHVGHAIGVRRPTPTEIGQQGQDSIETYLSSKNDWRLLKFVKHSLFSSFLGNVGTHKPKLKSLIFKLC